MTAATTTTVIIMKAINYVCIRVNWWSVAEHFSCSDILLSTDVVICELSYNGSSGARKNI